MRRSYPCASLLAILAAASLVMAEQPKAPVPAGKPHALITVSKETTYITGPLRKDGYVDYVAALNQMTSKDVTPENNAAVPFLEAMGPGHVAFARPPEFLAEYLNMLGVAPLPEEGDYFVRIEDYAKALKFLDKFKKQFKGADAPAIVPGDSEITVLQNQLNQAERRPWSRKEFPVIAGWLATNEKPLALLAEASKRPRLHFPLLSSEKSLQDAFLENAVNWGEPSRPLIARAMLRAAEGKANEAWEDLLASHRLARLVAKGPSLFDSSAGATADLTTCVAEECFLRRVQLTAARSLKMCGDLDRLSPLPSSAEAIDLGERFAYLDCAGVLARQGLSALKTITYFEPEDASEWPADSALCAAIDWDVVCRVGNAWYDRVVAAKRRPTRTARAKAFRTIEEEIGKEPGAAKDWKRLARSVLDGPREVTSRRVGNALAELMLGALVSSERQFVEWGDMRFELTKLAFALAAYRADHGAYPAKLAEMSPHYAQAIPKDIFNDAELHYKSAGGGYLLYSVGPNGRDDGGKGPVDCKNGEDWDDISILMPAEKSEKK